MFVDAPAIVAILAREDDAVDLVTRFEKSYSRVTSALAIYEAVTAITRIRSVPVGRARSIVTAFLDRSGISIMTIGEAECHAALDAFERYGKGRHPARLNMGNCFAYACARTRGLPLLFKGDEFSQTDISVA